VSADHDLAVAYVNEAVPGVDIDGSAWRSWAYTDGQRVHYHVRGPCPRCRAVGQEADWPDDDAPVESQGQGVAPPSVQSTDLVEVPVFCACGHDHGRANATSCGRSWSIVVPRVKP
jgi:hypothetical protein